MLGIENRGLNERTNVASPQRNTLLLRNTACLGSRRGDGEGCRLTLRREFCYPDINLS